MKDKTEKKGMNFKWSKEYISPILYLSAATSSLITAYGAFSSINLTSDNSTSTDLKNYNIASGVASTASGVLWFAGAIYDIYSVYIDKRKTIQEDDQYEDDIENNLPTNRC